MLPQESSLICKNLYYTYILHTSAPTVNRRRIWYAVHIVMLSVQRRVFSYKNRRSCHCTSYCPSANLRPQTAVLQNAERLLYHVLSVLKHFLISQTIYRYRPVRLLSSGYSDRFQSISFLRAIRADRVGHLHHDRHPSRDVPNRYLSRRFSPEHL